MRASAAAALAAVLLAASARAHDEGKSVTFGAAGNVRFTVAAQGAGPSVVYESGVSDPLPDAWDTVLIQGVLPDPAIAFQAARPSVTAPENWELLEMHRFADGRFWAKGRIPKAAGPLELRALDIGARTTHDVEIYGVEVFAADPVGPSAGLAPPRGPQDPTATRPFVHGRAEWGAVAPAEPYSPDPLPWRVTLHHSDGKYTRTLAESEAEAKFIQDFHIHGRGWNDIAYHFLVDPSGNILEGRPEGTLGAHTLGNNEGNIGIVLLGTYHPPVNNRPTKAQLDAVAALGRYLVARYGIDPKELKGHRDYKQTDCPGNLAYAKLDALRSAFAGLPVPDAVARRLKKAKAPSLTALQAPSFDGAQRAQ
ncbi:MAG: N-acetylmuramoyl-L-alanine amidase [Elusimicrobia bacterium]|nr:N-acetylmuramoyl-L-alanine amidase [Elusimicrobiota bacterium]